MSETGWGGVLSPETCALLADVDAAFALTGFDLPQWPDPYAVGPGPDEAAHERFSDPARFQIVVARAQAWITVLLDRGWATPSTHAGWAFSPLDPGGRKDVTVLEPSAAGAVKLVVVVHHPITGDDPFAVTIAAGDPAVPLTLVPDCACDGCDSGSDSLLEDLDQWVLSVVDGSLVVDISTTQNSIRTSFGSGGGTVQRLLEPTSFRAAPWSAGWT